MDRPGVGRQRSCGLGDRLARGLDEARLTALEDRLDARLRLGYHRDVVDELTGLVAAHPLRERLTGQLMLALHRADRTGEALRAFRDAKERLADALGLDPGTSLQETELAILRGYAGPTQAGSTPVPLLPAVAATQRPALLPAAVAGFAVRGDTLDKLDSMLQG